MAELDGADRIDWERLLIDASLAKAPEEGEKTSQIPPPTAAILESKHHVLSDVQGIPLKITLTAADVNEVNQALHVLKTMHPVGGKP